MTKAMQVTRHHDAPESSSQAETWEATKSLARGYGLCIACASQLAWGHQLGFARVEHQPCSACAPLVASLPKSRPMGWRTVDGSASRGSSWAAAVNAAVAPPTAPGGALVPGSAAVPAKSAHTAQQGHDVGVTVGEGRAP